MKLAIVLSTLFSTFATSVPNLCDDVFVDALGQPLTDSVGQTLSRYCAWTGPDAPAWDADVCCTFDDDSAACSVPLATGCPTGTTRRYCKDGRPDARGGVPCYHPCPGACEAGICVQAPDLPPPVEAFLLCCGPGGACQHVEYGQGWACNGELPWCDYGSMDGNGFV